MSVNLRLKLRERALSSEGGTYWAVNRPAAGTAYSLPTRLFPVDNWWNIDISGVAVDAQSSTLLGPYGGALMYDFGDNYGLPFCTVSGNHPKVQFAGGSYWDESDDVPYPIPIQALTEYGWTEYSPSGLLPLNVLPDDGADHHLLIWDKDNSRLYEIYQGYYNDTAAPVAWPAGGTVQPGEFYCASACYWDATTNNTRTVGWTSSDAAGLQVLPGLVQYDEVTGSSAIAHAHRMTFNTTPNYYVWPATHKAWSGGTVPLGARLRLKASFDISGFSAPGQRLLQSLKTYGLINADNGTTGHVTGTNDARWGNYESTIRVQMATALQSVQINRDMEIVTLGYGEP